MLIHPRFFLQQNNLAHLDVAPRNIMYDQTTKRWVLIDVALYEIGSYSREAWILFHKRQSMPIECAEYEDLAHTFYLESDGELFLTREMYESLVTRNPSLGGWIDADDDLWGLYDEINQSVNKYLLKTKYLLKIIIFFNH